MPSVFFRVLFLACVLALPVAASPAQAREPSSGDFPGSFSVLAEKLLPSVVNISSTQKFAESEDMPIIPEFPPGSPFEDFFQEFMDRRGRGMPSLPPASLGSGFVIDAENGYIVTNGHVISDAQDVRVTFHDDETLEAEIIGRDEKTDIAVLKVRGRKNMSAVAFGNSDDMRVGDWILAIGNPFGLGGTVTAGIVSAQKRDINAGPYDDFIQTDASINRGNSGGPMFNMKGEVIGINTAIFSPTGGSVGIGFAIPSSLAEPVIEQLISYGRTRRGWLGVRVQTVTEEIAESLGLEAAAGALVASVTAGGPAEKAGLESGDIILEVDGQRIPTMRELPRIVASIPVEKSVPLVYWRDGKRHTIQVAIGELEKAEEEGLLATGPRDRGTGLVIESVGLSLLPLTDADKRKYNVPSDMTGVLIGEVTNLSEAAEKGLMPGDVILEINQQAVTEPEATADLIQNAEKSGRNSVLLLVSREGDVRFVALRFKKK